MGTQQDMVYMGTELVWEEHGIHMVMWDPSGRACKAAHHSSVTLLMYSETLEENILEFLILLDVCSVLIRNYSANVPG